MRSLQVTLEIDTSPPKSDLPDAPQSWSEHRAVSVEELIGKLQKLDTEFVYPHELLE